ncbi:PTS system galactitol-specific EIIA component [Peribacillus simplex]|uniref:PTS sugar transporter subunit IIA n=1 Tax=Peribacillus simplex TaxID=1478 RepID=UPI001DAAA643|nr:PTS sugar transporter subunit IIA [Peribacillus simplex]CAH0303134.1 PTS system galactitol-specific EIIA component [Peribacillus simplex]
MNFDEYFNADLVFFLESTSKEEVFERMTSELNKLGYVKDTFFKAISKREKVYPTGLLSNQMGVAIPHTDSTHVNKPVIGVAILKNPINFIQMGTSDEDLDVSIIFMLAVKNPANQVEVLQVIIELIQNQFVLNQIKESSTKENVIKIIKNFSQVCN